MTSSTKYSLGSTCEIMTRDRELILHIQRSSSLGRRIIFTLRRHNIEKSSYRTETVYYEVESESWSGDNGISLSHPPNWNFTTLRGYLFWGTTNVHLLQKIIKIDNCHDSINGTASIKYYNKIIIFLKLRCDAK